MRTKRVYSQRFHSSCQCSPVLQRAMFIPRRDCASVSFKGCRLILPCISVGNVAQLAVDVLINTLRLSRVGHLHHRSLLPLTGRAAFAHTPHSLHTSAEVYHSPELKIAVVQIRTPIAKGCQQLFCDALLEWVKESQFTDTVLLTSTHAHERRDSQIVGSSFRYLLSSASPSSSSSSSSPSSSSPSSSSLHKHFLDELQWLPLEPRSHDPSDIPQSVSGSLHKSQLFLPGSGFAKRLYLQCCSGGLSLAVLILSSSQGDNIPEALELVSLLDSWLLLRDKSNQVREQDKKLWSPPPSWDLMYGGPSPQSLY